MGEVLEVFIRENVGAQEVIEVRDRARVGLGPEKLAEEGDVSEQGKLRDALRLVLPGQAADDVDSVSGDGADGDDESVE